MLCRSWAARALRGTSMPVSAADTRLKLSLSYHVPLCVSRMMVFFFPQDDFARFLLQSPGSQFGWEHNRDYCLGVKW